MSRVVSSWKKRHPVTPLPTVVGQPSILLVQEPLELDVPTDAYLPAASGLKIAEAG